MVNNVHLEFSGHVLMYFQADDEAKLVAWLASWLPKEERVKYEFLPKNIPWPQNMVESVILNSLEMSCSNLLSGFRLFLPVRIYFKN